MAIRLTTVLSNLVYGTRSQNSYDTINHGSHNRATLDERRVLNHPWLT